MTVAPLTNTVLGAVPQHHAGVASGANNAISRVAGLLAIAAVGAIVSAQFGSALDRELAGRSLTPAAQAAVREVKDRPLTGGVPAHPELDRAVEAASVHAYHVGLGVGGGLVILGGVIALVGIVNPARGARRSGRRPTAPRRSCIRVRSADGRPRPSRLASLSLVRIPELTPRLPARRGGRARGPHADRLHGRGGAADRLRARAARTGRSATAGVAPPLETHAWIEYGNRMISGVVGARRGRPPARSRSGGGRSGATSRCSACCCRSASSARRCSAASPSATTSRPAS